ncbi:hypothetical protein [Enterobacter ludwigii]
MQPERSGFHRSHLSLLVAGFLLCGSVHARTGNTADFLSAVGDIPVPPPVSAPVTEKEPSLRQAPLVVTERPVSTPRPSARPVVRAETKETSMLKRRLEKAVRENADLKHLAADVAIRGRNRESTVTALRAKAETLSGQLAKVQQALNAAEAAKQQASQEALDAQKELKRLTLLNQALSVKADVAEITAPSVATRDKAAVSEELARVRAKLTEQQAASGGLHDEMIRLKDTLAQREGQLSILTQQNAGLQAQLTALVRSRDQLQKQVDDTRRQTTALENAAGKQHARLSALDDERDSLKKAKEQADGAIASVKTQLATVSQARDEMKTRLTDAEQKAQLQTQALKDTQLQLNKLTADRNTLQKTVAELRGQNAQLKTAADTQAADQVGAADVRRQLAVVTTERDALQKNIATLTAQVTELRARPVSSGENTASGDGKAAQKIQAQNDQIAALTRQLAEKTPAEPELKTEAQQQAYAGGVMLSRTLLRSLALQKNLGLDVDPTPLLAGVSDSVRGKIRLADDVLSKQYQALIGQLSSREEKKYREGELALEKEVAGKKMLKRNRTVFFVQAIAGKAKLKSGDTVVFDLKESVLKGHVLHDNKGVKAVLDEHLPYLVHEALSFAGRGGVVNVYCMASDVYPPEQIPEGLYGYSPLKFTLSVSK